MQEEQREARGVQNPRVVDLISVAPSGDEVVLCMLEERTWEGAEQLRELEAKFNAYLSYVQGGYLAREYPQYEGKRVCFQLDCAEPPQGDAERILAAMERFAVSEGIRFVVNAGQS